jgi:hypothetical protein
MGDEDAVAQGFVAGVVATPGRTNGGEYNTIHIVASRQTALPAVDHFCYVHNGMPIILYSYNGTFFCAYQYWVSLAQQRLRREVLFVLKNCTDKGIV